MIITLTSDFGYQDNYVAIIKALLHTRVPEATQVDLTHSITPYHLLQCAYILSSALPFFPAGSVHFSLFDAMYASPAKVLIAEKQRQYIISSDNGLLPLILNDETRPIYSWPEVPATYAEWITFSADLIAKLSQEGFRPDALPVHHPQAFSVPPRPVFKDNTIECHIVHVDQFGNVILNLTKEDFEAQQRGRKFRIVFRNNEHIDTISNSYSEVPPKEKLCLFNNAGHLEIAINKDSAARLLGLSLFNTSSLVYQTIRIEFV